MKPETRVLNLVPCRMEGCQCGEPHPAYGDCDACRGHGHILGGDEYQPCPACTLRFQRGFGPFLEALREIPDRDREAAEDRVDVEAKQL